MSALKLKMKMMKNLSWYASYKRYNTLIGSGANYDSRVRETIPMMLSEVHDFSNVSHTEKTYE